MTAPRRFAPAQTCEALGDEPAAVRWRAEAFRRSPAIARERLGDSANPSATP